MKEFEKLFRAWYEACRDGNERSAEGRNILRKLYSSVPKEISFSKFMDAFMARPTWNVDASTNYMLAWVENELKK